MIYFPLTAGLLMAIVTRCICTALLASGLAASALAQSPPGPKATPEETGKNMRAAMDAMVPMMGRMAEASIETQLRIAERPETAARVATYKRNLYEALLKKGFSGDQAIQLTIATPLPSAYATK
jgi:hypothetical protein